MASFFRSALFAVALGSGLAAVFSAPAQTPATESQDGTYVINLRDTEIRVFAEQVSKITGRTLIVEPSVKGPVTVISAQPLTVDGVWELFQSVLRVNGFAALKAGASWRIVPQATVNQGGATLDGGGASQSQDLVTRLIPLANLPSDDAVRVLRPLVASFGYLEGLKSPNAIVVTDYAENVRRVEELARKLDTDQETSFTTIILSYASAKDVAQAIERVIADPSNGQAGRSKIAVDERSNSLLVRADPRQLVEIKRLASSLDTPGGASATTRVFRLNYGDAETIAEVLNGLIGSETAPRNPVSRSLSADNGAGGAARTPIVPPAKVVDIAASAGVVSPASAADQVQTGSSSAGVLNGDISIQPAKSINAIVVRGSPSAIVEVASLIAELDVRRPQVMIEAAIVEITGDAAEQLGIQLGLNNAVPPGGIAATSFSTLGLSLDSILTALGAPAALGILDNGLSIGASRDDFGILIQALSRSTSANLLSTPSITTLDNQPAEIVVGQNVPFRTGSFTTTNNSANPFTTIERKDVGITLRVVPRVNDGDVIQLEVSQEVSSLVNGTVAGAADLVTNRRSIQTTVLADNRGTIVLGGLISDDELTAETGVPILSDVPVLGELFKADTKSRSKRTLFIFLRPTILRNRTDVRNAANDKYDRLQALDSAPEDRSSLLLAPKTPKLPLEIGGLY